MKNGWNIQPLSAVCQKTKSWNPEAEPRSEFVYIDVSAVSNQTFRIASPATLSSDNAPSRARKLVRHGDTIFATVRPSLKRIAIIGKEYDNQIASTAFCVLRPKQDIVCPSFLYFQMLSDEPNRKIVELQRGVSYPAVTDGDILRQTGVFPPLPEQRKIATVLAKIQRAVELQDATIANVRELKKSLMHRLFTHGLRGEKLKQTEIGEMPVSWEAKPVQDAYSFTSKPRSVRYADFEQLPFLPMELIPAGKTYVTEYLLKSPTDIASGVYFEQGDFLLPKITPCFENGKQAIIKELPGGFGIATTEVIPIKGIPGRSDNRFLSHYLRLNEVRNGLAGKMAGSTGRQRLAKDVLAKQLTPLPSLAEQVEIINILETVETKLAVHETKKSALQDLFKTTLNQLMTGTVRVADLDIDTSKVGA